MVKLDDSGNPANDMPRACRHRDCPAYRCLVGGDEYEREMLEAVKTIMELERRLRIIEAAVRGTMRYLRGRPLSRTRLAAMLAYAKPISVEQLLTTVVNNVPAANKSETEP